MKIYIFQRLAHLLYQAAEDAGYVDPHRIKQILGISREEVNLSRLFERMFTLVVLT